MTAANWDPAKHPHGEHGHWATTVQQSLRKFDGDGGSLQAVSADEADIEKDQLDDMIGMDPDFGKDIGVGYTRIALNSYHDFGEEKATVYVAHAEGLGVAGAISIVDYPERSHVDYLGSTGLAKGTGTALAVQAAKHAARRGLPLTGEPTDEAEPFWRKLGWKEDPTGDGWDIWGWNAQDTAKVAAP